MKTWMILLTALAVPANPAMAQGLNYSDEATEACLAQVDEGGDPRSCIGRSADLCMETSEGGYSTVGMGGCLDRERAYWDGVLNARYGDMRARAADFDAAGGPGGTETALRDMQRAWIDFRDATCAFEASQWGGGTGAGPAALSCLMRMTGEQALYLDTAWSED